MLRAEPHPRRRRRLAFTLTELLIAIAILVVVIIATGNIFATVSKVTAAAQSNADVLAEAAAIEKRFRADIERISREGVLAIRNVAVKNDINVPLASLLDPNLPADAVIRCDQLVFFTNGAQNIQTFNFEGPGGTNVRPQGAAAKVLYSHAVQVKSLGSVDPYNGLFDDGTPLQPWTVNLSPSNGLDMSNYNHNIAAYSGFDTPMGVVVQGAANEWVLVRQGIAMSDDGGNPTILLNEAKAAPSLWESLGGFPIPNRTLTNGRLDAAASSLSDLRSVIQTDWSSSSKPTWPWLVNNGALCQRDLISRLVLGRHAFGSSTPPISSPIYPRAARIAESMDRADQAQTLSVLSSACSSFIVDWTYDNGDGVVNYVNKDGYTKTVGNYAGMQHLPWVEHPWFGMTDDARAVAPLATPFTGPDLRAYNWGSFNGANPRNIEGLTDNTTKLPEFQVIGQSDVRMYEAIFGYNQSDPSRDGFTPWPSALRITMTLHDPKTRLERGRTFQFVIRLPKRAN